MKTIKQLVVFALIALCTTVVFSVDGEAASLKRQIKKRSKRASVLFNTPQKQNQFFILDLTPLGEGFEPDSILCRDFTNKKGKRRVRVGEVVELKTKGEVVQKWRAHKRFRNELKKLRRQFSKGSRSYKKLSKLIRNLDKDRKALKPVCEEQAVNRIPEPTPEPTPDPSGVPTAVPTASPTGSPTPLPSPTPTPFDLRINSGGSQYIDTEGNTWIADSFFTLGDTFSSSNPISGTADPALYQTERFGFQPGADPINILYDIPVPRDATYEVTLHFVELYHTEAAKRVFDVLMEGQLVELNLDVFNEVGKETALQKTYSVVVSDGSLDIDFFNKINFAEVAAIEVHEHKGDGFLHVVIKADSFAVDYDGDGSEVLLLNGEDSHTHEPGKAIAGWTWKDGSSVIGSGQNISTPLSLGDHNIELTIADTTSPPKTLADSQKITVYPINRVGGSWVEYFKLKTGTLFNLFDNPTGSPDHVEVLQNTQVLPLGGKIGGSPFTSDTVVVLKSFFDAPTPGSYEFVALGGEFNLVKVNGGTVNGPVSLSAGQHSLEVRFAVSDIQDLPGNLLVSIDGGSSLMVNSAFNYQDHTSVLPFINDLTPQTGSFLGGQMITITGQGFFSTNPATSPVKVHWGSTVLQGSQISISPDEITFASPTGTAGQQFTVTVETPNGMSNGKTFEYDSSAVVAFNQSTVATNVAQNSQFGVGPTQAAWGPDGKLYVGTTGGEIVTYSFDENLNVVSKSSITTLMGDSSPTILGLAFNPTDDPSGPIRIYVGHAELFAQNNGGCPTANFPYNGEVSVLTGPTFSKTTLIDNLPVSNHDHGINGMVFDNQGDLYFSIGGNTNAGVEDCNIGGLPETPYSGAIIKAEVSKPGFNGNVQYLETLSSNLNMDQRDGDIVDPAPGLDLSVYTPGIRNAFDIVFTTWGEIYGTDNGANVGFGSISTGPNSSAPSVTDPDEILLLMQGHYYGHPNRNRGRTDARQNIYRGPFDTPQLGEFSGVLGTNSPSNNGIVEYRSEAFDGELRGALLTKRFSFSAGGDLFAVELSADGRSITAMQNLAEGLPGLDVQMAPGGSLLTVDYTGNNLVLLKPQSFPSGLKATDITPWRAPAQGGSIFIIGGSGFGTSLSDISVKIGNIGASLTTVADNRIEGVIPANLNPDSGVLDIEVKKFSSNEVSVISNAFRYVFPSGVGTGNWKPLAGLPVALGEVAAGIIDGVLYIIGEGSNGTYAYDFPTGAWTTQHRSGNTLAPRPHIGHHHAAEVVNGKFYLFGGLHGGSDNKVQIYNPDTNTWSLGANIPMPAGSAATAVINGKVYFAGGIDDSGATGVTVNRTYEYDPIADSWTAKAPMPFGVNHPAAETDGAYLWVFGGRDGPNTVGPGYNHTQKYDPVTDTWDSTALPASTLAVLPQKRGGMGKAVYFDGEFYVMGGETNQPGQGQVNGNVYDRVDVYNPLTNTWRLDKPMMTPRHGHFPLLYNDRIVVAAGGLNAGYGQSNVMDEFYR